MKTKTNPRVFRRRLLLLCTFLEKLPPSKRFSYRKWVGDDWQGLPDLSCGTSACALGWGTVIPSFRKLGLRLFRPGPDDLGGYVGLKNHRCNSMAAPWHASKKLFGLNEEEAAYIFTPDCDLPSYAFMNDDWGLKMSPAYNASAKQVAKHIRAFVAKKYPLS
jgi:hypothetical protein